MVFGIGIQVNAIGITNDLGLNIYSS